MRERSGAGRPGALQTGGRPIARWHGGHSRRSRGSPHDAWACRPRYGVSRPGQALSAEPMGRRGATVSHRSPSCTERSSSPGPPGSIHTTVPLSNDRARPRRDRTDAFGLTAWRRGWARSPGPRAVPERKVVNGRSSSVRAAYVPVGVDVSRGRTDRHPRPRPSRPGRLGRASARPETLWPGRAMRFLLADPIPPGASAPGRSV